jgi:hypothetical protein
MQPSPNAGSMTPRPTALRWQVGFGIVAAVRRRWTALVLGAVVIGSGCGTTTGPWPNFIDEPDGFTAHSVPGVSPSYCGVFLTPHHGTDDVHARLLRWVTDNATLLRVDSNGTIHGYIPQTGTDNVPIVVSFSPTIGVSFCD